MSGTHGPARDQLILILGPNVCHVCLNHKRSRLHRELCVTGTEGTS